MLNFWNCLAVLLCFWLNGSSQAQQHVGELGVRNSITIPGQDIYYLMADAGPIVGAKDELRRTNRSAWKWWGDLFNQNNCCNNNNNLHNCNNILPTLQSPLIPVGPTSNCNGLSNDPFKDLKLFKKLPDIWGNTCAGQCNQCGYQPPPQPADYKPLPAPYSNDYETPNPANDGPGDGNVGYAEYDKPAEVPSLPSYEPPSPPAVYEPVAPIPGSYSKVDDHAQFGKSYGGAQPPQIVYQPIIYLTATDPKIEKDQYQQQAKIYQPEVPAPVFESPAPAPAPIPVDLPVYVPPAAQGPAPASYNAPTYAGYTPLVCGRPASVTSPPASYNSPCTACQTPIRLSVVDQPYRVAPELFKEYNYRLALGGQQSSY